MAEREFGSLDNYICGKMMKEPEPAVGMGATEICWTDRHPYRITRIQNGKKGEKPILFLRRIKVEADPTARIGEQKWIYGEEIGGEEMVKFRKSRSAWYFKNGRIWGSRVLIGHAEEYYDWSF